MSLCSLHCPYSVMTDTLDSITRPLAQCSCLNLNTPKLASTDLNINIINYTNNMLVLRLEFTFDSDELLFLVSQ